MLLIQNGRVMDPATGTDDILDVFLVEDRIALMKKNLTREECIAFVKKKKELPSAVMMQVIDAEGCIVTPGLIDTHVHFRDPGFTEKEDIHTGACAAAKGGYTSVIMMANTKPAIDCAEVLKDSLSRAAKEKIHIYACANVTKGMKGKELVDFDEMGAAGAAGFTDDGLPILPEELIRDAMREAKRVNRPISLHEEDPQFISENGVNAGGSAAAFFHMGGADREAEISMVRRDTKIAVEENAPLCIQHISAAESVELLREARKQNPDIHGEATPHHFSLTEDALIERGTLAKVNPPIRTERDRQAIIEGLRDHTIDLIATDHAPHTADEKKRSIERAPSGMIGLETAFSLALGKLVNEAGIPLMDVLRAMTINPARFYGLPAGELSEGKPADLMIFDPDAQWTVGKTFASKACNSPFIGEKLPGVIQYTIADGKIVYSAQDGLQ